MTERRKAETHTKPSAEYLSDYDSDIKLKICKGTMNLCQEICQIRNITQYLST